MKIVYCINSIRLLGGIERVTVVKANALAEVPGNEVYIAVLTDKKGCYTEMPSPKVKVVDLDAEFFPNGSPRSRIAYVWQSLKYAKAYQRKLSAFLHELNPDVVVSVGHAEFYLLPKISGPWKLVRELHMTANYRITLSKGESAFRHLTAWYGTIKDKLYYPKYHKVVTLTEWDKTENWSKARHVVVMPNPVSFRSASTSDLSHKRIISIGRLTETKCYDMLIRSFTMVHRRHPDWTLLIVGEGEQRASLQHLIDELQLSRCVHLPGRSSNVEKALLESSIFALSSKIEGFGLVILEAMECGLPVVACDCRHGPREIITDGHNGYLVPVGDAKTFAERLCTLIENQPLRRQMGKHAKETVQHYYPEALTQRWMNLFNELLIQ